MDVHTASFSDARPPNPGPPNPGPQTPGPPECTVTTPSNNHAWANRQRAERKKTGAGGERVRTPSEAYGEAWLPNRALSCACTNCYAAAHSACAPLERRRTDRHIASSRGAFDR